VPLWAKKFRSEVAILRTDSYKFRRAKLVLKSVEDFTLNFHTGRVEKNNLKFTHTVHVSA